MSGQYTKKQNLEVIRTRLQVHNLPTKFKALSSNVIAAFANSPELDPAIRVIIEQNDTIKSANGRRLSAEEQVKTLKFRLSQASQDFVNPSKSEIIQLWGKFFGKATKEDDHTLREIGAVSRDSVAEDLETSSKIVEEAIEIGEKYRKKYGSL